MKRQLWCMAALCLLLAGCGAGGGATPRGHYGGPPALRIMTTTLSAASPNVAYNATISGAGGSGSGYRWSVISGNLPHGLALASSGTPDTTLSGTPTQPGAYSFTIELRDDAGHAFHYTLSLGIAVPALSIAAKNLQVATQGVSYSESLTASGGAGNHQWRVSSGTLPPGLSLAPAGTPATTISGIPSTIGIYDFEVEVADGGSPRDSRAFSITVDYPGGAHDSWSAPLTGAPYFTGGELAWTGSKLLQWGGYAISSTGVPQIGWTPITDGTVYDPYAGTTSAMAACPLGQRDGYTAVWCGDRLIVWGGQDWSPAGPLQCDDGASYDPVTDTWNMVPSTGAPMARTGHSAVWTGSEMIVWGGYADGYGMLNDGAAYNPLTNRWRPLPTLNAPAGRYHLQAFFTNGRMVVWGGSNSAYAVGGYLNSGGVYDVASNSWATMDMRGFPDMDPGSYIAQTVDDVLYVWGYGGNLNGTHVDQWFGAGYDISGGVWTDLSATPPVSGNLRRWAQCCSTGSKLIMWGGVGDNGDWLYEGEIFDPATGRWSTMNTSGAPNPGGFFVFWTGNRMLAWGGGSGTQNYKDGAFYTP